MLFIGENLRTVRFKSLLAFLKHPPEPIMIQLTDAGIQLVKDYPLINQPGYII